MLLSLSALTACVYISPRPRLDPLTTPPPEASSLPSDMPTSEPESTTPEAQTSVPAPEQGVDDLGNAIYGGDHFARYISFSNVLVYEDEGDTFVDLTAVNAYPKLLLCAVNIIFYGEDGSAIASSSLQMPDGSFLLALESGETRLFARVLTDTLLTDKRFELVFDGETGIHPQ